MFTQQGFSEGKSASAVSQYLSDLPKKEPHFLKAEKTENRAHQFYDESGDSGLSIIIEYTQKKLPPGENGSDQIKS